MRAFVALELPSKFADETADLSQALSAKIRGRFMPKENLHITLAFLGDIGESQASATIDALDDVARQIHPLPIRSAGLGKFGKKQDATLWLGIEPKERLSQLARLVRDALEKRGVSYDDKPFVAHVTLARRANLGSANLAELPFPNPSQATTITLFKSELSSEGATYKALYSVELEG